MVPTGARVGAGLALAVATTGCSSLQPKRAADAPCDVDGELRWVRTDPVQGLFTGDSSKSVRGVSRRGDAIALLVGTSRSCELEVALVRGTPPEVTAREPSRIVNCDDAEPGWMPVGLGWDGESWLTGGACRDDDERVSLVRLPWGGRAGEQLFCVTPGGADFEVDLGARRLWSPNGGEVRAHRLDDGGSTLPVPIRPYGGAWSVAIDGADLWLANRAWEAPMRNYLTLADAQTGTERCTFDVEDVPGLSGKPMDGIAAAKRRIYLVVHERMVQLEWTPADAG